MRAIAERDTIRQHRLHPLGINVELAVVLSHFSTVSIIFHNSVVDMGGVTCQSGDVAE